MLEALAIAASLVLAGERSFFHLPSEEEVRIQTITRTDNEQDWPFSVDAGSLTCVWSAGTPVVMFFEQARDDFAESYDTALRGVLLSINPLELTIGNIANSDLFAPAESVEERLRAVAPFVMLGSRLCEQPPGAQLRRGEL